MNFYLQFNWSLFCIAFGITLLISFIMGIQGRSFYMMHLVIRKFSIIDFEFPASAQELASVIKDIFSLPTALTKKTLRALKSQLYLDFLLMPAIFGSIFILSMKVSGKMLYFGHGLFATLAWLQCIAWLCDVIENVYLLNKIRPEPVVSSPAVHKAYGILEIIKWGVPLLTTVCSFAAIFYYWLTGSYSDSSLYFLLITVIELIVFFGLKKLTSKTEKQKLDDFLGSNQL
jgi:hypothetical protein